MPATPRRRLAQQSTKEVVGGIIFDAIFLIVVIAFLLGIVLGVDIKSDIGFFGWFAIVVGALFMTGFVCIPIMDGLFRVRELQRRRDQSTTTSS